jgi:hypothetical protein
MGQWWPNVGKGPNMISLHPSLSPARRLKLAVAALPVAVGAMAASAQPTALVQAATVSGAGFEPTSAVAVIVKVPKPWYAPKSVVVGRMRDTMPQYESLPGLSFKAFSLAQVDGQYGGIYLWTDLASAKVWFSPAWFERVEKERGAKGDVRLYEVPVAIDNTPGGTPANAESVSVATVVSIAIPAGIGRQRLVKEFEAAIPVYQKVPGLMRKYFTLSEDGRFGGIYLWKDQASAERWFNDAWKERVRKTYGSESVIEWFDTPILLPSKLDRNKVSLPGL